MGGANEYSITLDFMYCKEWRYQAKLHDALKRSRYHVQIFHLRLEQNKHLFVLIYKREKEKDRKFSILLFRF
jgi:hypothetical protein